MIQEKQRLLKEVDQALEVVKLGADLLIGIALSNSKRRDSLQGTLGMEYVILAKGFDEALHQKQTDFGWAAKNAEFARLRAEVDTLLKGRHPFHWPLEFPEVFVGKMDDAGFAAIVGNPPLHINAVDKQLIQTVEVYQTRARASTSLLVPKVVPFVRELFPRCPRKTLWHCVFLVLGAAHK